MKDGKIVVARLWSRYEGLTPSRAPIILGIDPQKYQTICIYLMKNSEKPNFFERQGCETFYLSGKNFLRIFNLPIIWKLSKILKRQKVDILHCHRHQATVYGTIAAKIAAVPVIFAHVHGLQRSKNLRRKFINWIILRWVNKILTVGEAVRHDVLTSNYAVRPEQIVSLGNSIDYNRFASVQITAEQAKRSIGLKSDSFVFGAVGRLAPTKGHIYLIRAFARVKQQTPSAHLVLVGDGRSRNQLEAQAAKTAPESIHFLGQRDDVPELFRAMDVYVQPSIGSEGLPRALLEAMAAGIPCIGTELGGVPEIFDNGGFGFLVPPKDDSTLAEVMIKSARMSPLEREKLIDSARHRVYTCYTHRLVIERLEKAYDAEYAGVGSSKLKA